MGDGLGGRVALTREPMIVDNYSAWHGRAAQFDGVRVAAALEVPMLYRGELIGVLGVTEVGITTRRFDEADARLLSLFASQAAGAVHNARLLEETTERAQQLGLLYDAGLTLNRTLKPRVQLEYFCTIAAKALRADNTCFFRYDAARNDLGLEFGVGLAQEESDVLRDARFPLGAERGLIGWVAQRRVPLNLSDVTTEPRWIASDPAIRSALWVPVLHDDQLLGVLSASNTRLNAFTPQDERLFVLFANQVAVALENARLFEEVQQYAVDLEERVAQRTQELTAANEHLKELDRLKSQFILMMSHEYRTPLTTILSSAELLEHYSDRWSEDRKLEHLRRIVASVKHMTDLLESVLIIGKIEANKLDFVPVPIDLDKYCRELVEEIQLTAGSQYHLTLISRAPCVEANMDVNLLRHILSNVLSNAVKYSPSGGDIELELICEDEWAVLRIHDHGIGIPQPDQARIFEAFHRGSNIGNIPGTGLGMAIVNRSVALHHGTITIDSEVGVGTTVTITLPLGNSSTAQ